MKRILAFFENKVEAVKKERQVKRIYRTLDIAKDNAADKIDAIELKKSELMESLPKASDLDSIVRELSEYIGEQEEQQEIIKRADKVKAYLDEDVEVVEDKK